MCIVRPVPRCRASSAAPARSSSEARLWPTRVTQPTMSPPCGKASSTAAWRARTSDAGAANGPASISHPQVPTVPRRPTARSPAATRVGCATVPASITVVTPLRTQSTAAIVAESSSLAGFEVVGDAASREGVPREVLMSIDHARSDDAATRVEASGLGPAGEQLAARSDGHDPLTGDGDRPVAEHVARRIHRHDLAVMDDQVRRRRAARVRRWFDHAPEHRPTSPRRVRPQMAVGEASGRASVARRQRCVRGNGPAVSVIVTSGDRLDRSPPGVRGRVESAAGRRRSNRWSMAPGGRGPISRLRRVASRLPFARPTGRGSRRGASSR